MSQTIRQTTNQENNSSDMNNFDNKSEQSFLLSEAAELQRKDMPRSSNHKNFSMQYPGRQWIEFVAVAQA